jgi:ATP-dependent 26S proteasome regulatory subunit
MVEACKYKKLSLKTLTMSAAIASVGVLFAGTVLSIYRDEVKNTIENVVDLIYGNSHLEFKRGQNFRSAEVVEQLIIRQNGDVLHSVMDGHTEPEYEIDNGKYNISTIIADKVINIKVKITNKKIKLTAPVKLASLKQWFKSKYIKSNETDEKVFYYILNDRKWSHPIIRRTRQIDESTLSRGLREVSRDMEVFMNSSDNYEKNGLPYRRGYLLYGPSGTNKSLSVEVLAQKYQMSCYIVTLNSEKMNDATLIEMVAKIPPMSIIVFDEIEKQLKKVKENKNCHLSIAGILSAIDGPQRISYGSIIVMTSNSRIISGECSDEQLLRPGRIDKIIKFE